MAERSCIICKTKQSKENLIRLIVDHEEQLLFDLKQKAPQRGGYLCYKKRCITQLGKRNKDRKLGVFSVDISQNLILLKRSMEEQIKRYIIGWNLQGILVIGVEETVQQIDALRYVIIAKDIADRSKNRIERKGGDQQRLVLSFLNKEQLGMTLNRKDTVAIGIKKDFQRDVFDNILDRYEELFPQEHEWQE